MADKRQAAHSPQLSQNVPAVVFDRNDDAWIFRSYEDAATWMEAVDVIDGEYHAYDVDGYVLSLSVIEDEVLIRRTHELAYNEVTDRLRATMTNGPIVPADTLEGMVRQLLQLDKASGLRRRSGAIMKRLFRR